jgi:hypothetical protein
VTQQAIDRFKLGIHQANMAALHMIFQWLAYTYRIKISNQVLGSPNSVQTDVSLLPERGRHVPIFRLGLPIG